jgi:DNA-binding IclR family transcriptional regulator
MRAATRTLDVLEFVGQQGLPVSAADVSEACGIPKSSLYKLLRTLESRQYLASVAGGTGWTSGQRLVQLRSDSLLFVHAMAVLEALERGGGRLGPDDLAEHTELPPDMVERVLTALAAHDLVVPGYDGTFGLGLRLVSMASRVAWAERLQLTARPLLVRLRDQSRETASLIIEDDGQALYLDQVESHFDLRCRGWVGRRVPLEGTSVGEAFADSSQAHIVHDAVEAGVTAICCAIRGLRPSVGINIIGPTWRLEQGGFERWALAVRSLAMELEDAYSDILEQAQNQA